MKIKPISTPSELLRLKQLEDALKEKEELKKTLKNRAELKSSKINNDEKTNNA